MDRVPEPLEPTDRKYQGGGHQSKKQRICRHAESGKTGGDYRNEALVELDC
jgi:hypothetical protein